VVCGALDVGAILELGDHRGWGRRNCVILVGACGNLGESGPAPEALTCGGTGLAVWGGRASAPEALGQGADLTAYLLVLFAFRLSTVGYVVAGRELSIVFSTLIGSTWMNEGRLLPRLARGAVALAR